MNKHDFYFELPTELIAHYPLAQRSDSRLLLYSRQSGTYFHHYFNDITNFLQPGDLLVMNDTKVMPARFYGKKLSGGKVELLIERITGEYSFIAHIKASKAPKAGTIIVLDEDQSITVTGRQDDLFMCQSAIPVEALMERIGHIPLPLYITRADETLDKERYQTVYAKYLGSVAAPTAGLHFDEAVFARLKACGVHVAYLTLHVGAGTFRPVRSEQIADHKMHAESFSISAELCAAIAKTKAAGKRVIAVGTTALRSLESAAQQGALAPCNRETDIFIYPGYQFKVCDGLLTNFHLPESTLLMLVAAFIGHKNAMDLYQEAIKERYRFYSYGDASLLL